MTVWSSEALCAPDERLLPARTAETDPAADRKKALIGRRSLERNSCFVSVPGWSGQAKRHLPSSIVDRARCSQLERRGLDGRKLGALHPLWLTITPPLPNDAQAAAQAKGGIVLKVCRNTRSRLQKGKALREIPEDIGRQEPAERNLKSHVDRPFRGSFLFYRHLRPQGFTRTSEKLVALSARTS